MQRPTHASQRRAAWFRESAATLVHQLPILLAFSLAGAPAAPAPAAQESGAQESGAQESGVRESGAIGLDAADPRGPWEGELWEDAADGTLDNFSLLEAALIAGGTSDAGELTRLLQKCRGLTQTVNHQTAAQPLRTLPRELHEAMHRVVLTGDYQADCSELQRTLDEGNFNCVTATLIYLHLCRVRGLRCVAVVTPAHVFARVYPQPRGPGTQHPGGPRPAAPQDVQTTCARWFQRGLEEAVEVPGDARGRSGDGDQRRAAAEPLAGRDLTDVQLVAKLYYNRAVQLLAQERFAAAISALKVSLRLDPLDAMARKNLVAAYNNWALQEAARQRFAKARELLQSAQAVNPDFSTLRSNMAHVNHQWVTQLLAEHRYREALGVLETAEQDGVEAWLRESRQTVIRRWVEAVDGQGAAAAVQPLLTDYRAELSREQLRRLEAARDRTAPPAAELLPAPRAAP